MKLRVHPDAIERPPYAVVEFPFDLTAVSNAVIGQQHSYWAARHAYSLFAMAEISSRLAAARHDLKLEEAKFWASTKGDYKNKWEMEYAMAVESVPARKLQRTIARLSTKLELVKALSEAYEGLRNAASREMSRRLGERAQAE